MYPVLFGIFIPCYVLTYFTLPALGLYLATIITCHQCEGKGLGVCFSKIKRDPQTASLKNSISLNPTKGLFWCPGVLHTDFFNQPRCIWISHVHTCHKYQQFWKQEAPRWTSLFFNVCTYCWGQTSVHNKTVSLSNICHYFESMSLSWLNCSRWCHEALCHTL